MVYLTLTHKSHSYIKQLTGVGSPPGCRSSDKAWLTGKRSSLPLFLAATISPTVLFPSLPPSFSAFAAVLWPSVPFTVPEDRVGVAYGLTTAIQNGGLALFPLLAAAIYKV